eukprot:2533011-Alexandrium_andersonii.AAC.1
MESATLGGRPRLLRKPARRASSAVEALRARVLPMRQGWSGPGRPRMAQPHNPAGGGIVGGEPDGRGGGVPTHVAR